MSIFQLNNEKKLIPLNEKKVDLEKEIQKIIEGQINGCSIMWG